MKRFINRISFLGFYSQKECESLFSRVNESCFAINEITIIQILFTSDNIVSIDFTLNNNEYVIQASILNQIYSFNPCKFRKEMEQEIEFDFRLDAISVSLLFDRISDYTFFTKEISIIKKQI